MNNQDLELIKQRLIVYQEVYIEALEIVRPEFLKYKKRSLIEFFSPNNICIFLVFITLKTIINNIEYLLSLDDNVLFHYAPYPPKNIKQIVKTIKADKQNDVPIPITWALTPMGGNNHVN